MKKAELVRKIRKEFPDLKFTTAKHNVEGWDHYVLILDDKYVFRFPRKKEYLKKLSTEVGLFEYLKNKVPVPIPQYIFVAKDKSFAGYKMLHGTQLKPEILHKLSAHAQDVIARQIASFMSAMHKVPLKIAQRFDPQLEKSGKVNRETGVKIRKLIFPKITAKDKFLITKYLKELLTIKFSKKVFIHYDLYPSHLLLADDKKSLSGIIDFADRAIEDPAVDFCELWVYGKKFIETVYKYYIGPKDPGLLHRSQLYYKRMSIWMMISTAEDKKGNFKEQYKRFREIFS